MMQHGIRHKARIGRASDVRSRQVPLDYADAVETWARHHGGHATLRWLPAPMNCWCVVLSYRIGDPRQGGEDDGEKVLLHDYWTVEEWLKNDPARAPRHWRTGEARAGAYAFELDELGVEGLIERLNRGNILSGRGEFDSVMDPVVQQREKHEATSERRRLSARDDAGHRAKDIRRSRLKIPFIGVGIEFTKAPPEQSTQEG